MSRVLAVLVLIVALIAAPASAAQSYGVPGKSSFEGDYVFVSGATEYALFLRYRATESWELGAGFESLSATGVSGTGVGFGAAYYFSSNPKFEPYFFAQYVSLTISISGLGTGTGSGVQFGVGAHSWANDQVRLGGSVGVSSIAGSSITVYGGSLEYHFTDRDYVVLGITGGGGSSNFFTGFGTNF